MVTVNKPALITASQVGLVDGKRTLLHDISLSIHQGKIVSLIGPNGAGKTSLLNILLGLRAPTTGTVTRAQQLIIGYMPQRLQLNPQLPLSVERFLSLTERARGAIDRALSRSGIHHLSHTSLHDLSGGELQRVLLARALLRQPQLLILDEPAQGLDVAGQRQLYQLIAQLRDEWGLRHIDGFPRFTSGDGRH